MVNFKGVYTKNRPENIHFWLTNYKIFLRKGVLPLSNPRKGTSPQTPVNVLAHASVKLALPYMYVFRTIDYDFRRFRQIYALTVLQKVL